MPDRTRSRLPRWLVPAAIVAVAALALVFSLQGTDPDEPSDPAAAQGTTDTGPAEAEGDADDGDPGSTGGASGVVEPEETMVDMARRDAADPLTAGPVDAPVAMVVYSDYQCPFCAVWSHETEPTLMDYVDSGDLRIEWRDVNVFGEESELAARAAYAAALQDAFWEYHGLLFAGGETRSATELDDDGLVALAAELGLDTERFIADLASDEVAQAVTANAEEGRSIGAFSTPAFLVNGSPIVGAQPTEVFVAAVEDALAAS